MNDHDFDFFASVKPGLQRLTVSPYFCFPGLCLCDSGNQTSSNVFVDEKMRFAIFKGSELN